MDGHILLAIDPNHEESWMYALPEALDAAKRHGSKLHLLSIVPDYGPAMIRDFLPANFEKEALQKAKAAIDEFGGKHVPAGVKWEGHVGHGHVVEEILRVAEATHAGLIVMGSHQPSEIRHFFVGSYADKVVHRARTSVLVVRGPDI